MGYHAGGQLHVAEVSQSGAKAFQIHDWEDQLGRPIKPLPPCRQLPAPA
jgi:hypothetical protein